METQSYNPHTTSIPPVYCSRCGMELHGSYMMTGDGLIICSICQMKPHHTEQQPIGLTGWICPVCGKGNSPYKMQCDCEPHVPIKTNTDFTLQRTY